LDERIHPDDLGRIVAYHTHYSATGWASRSLSPDEVGIAFGWPAWARQGSQLSSALPSLPLQILDGCLKGILSSIPRDYLLSTPSPTPAGGACDRSWLPSIHKFLSHAWIDAAIVTDKAAKRDDAGVPTHLWDQRCSLVLPYVTKPALDRF
jgi:hypothetical protein